MIRNSIAILGAALVLAAPSQSRAVDFAIWLEGYTDAGGGGNPILTAIDHYFGPGDYTLVTTAQLETPGFLNSFNAVIVSRHDASFGSPFSAAAAANIQAYVGAPGPGQGGVALFSNDIADNLYGTSGYDPYDPNLDALFYNAMKYAAASHHGFIGEFPGAVMGVAANTAGWPALGLLPGTANAVHSYGPQFVYDVGPVGPGNPIDQGVTFPFTDGDMTTYLTDITGADPNTIVDIYTSAGIVGEPAVLANQFIISGGTFLLTPTAATNYVGATHTVTATATTNAQPVSGVTVSFAVTGANSATGSGITDNNGMCSFSYTGLNAGSDTITATASFAGITHSISVSKLWVVSPIQPPILQVFSSISASAEAGTCSATVTGAQFDNGSYSPQGGPLTFTLAPPPPYPVGTNVVTLTVTDTNGLSASTNVMIVVVDTTPPTIVCPAPITVEFQDQTGAVASYVVTASDACSSVSLEASPPSGSLFPIGVTPVEAVAVDDYGNTNQCAFSVTVLGAEGVKSNVLAELVALRSTVKPCSIIPCSNDYWELSQAIEDMIDALGLDVPAAPSWVLHAHCLTLCPFHHMPPKAPLWLNQTHVACCNGSRVFINEQAAVFELQEIICNPKSSISHAVALDMINRLVKCDRLLAMVSINDAVSAGANTKAIAGILNIVAQGDKAAAANEPILAIGDYWIAWSKCPCCKTATRFALHAMPA